MNFNINKLNNYIYLALASLLVYDLNQKDIHFLKPKLLENTTFNF